MTLKIRLKRFREGLDRSHSGPKDFFDNQTYKGNIRWLVFSCVATYAMWSVYDVLAWVRYILDIPYEIDLGRQSWARLWALILGGMGILTAIVAMILIPINRRRACKSTEGQWYDQPDLNPADLHSEVPAQHLHSPAHVRARTWVDASPTQATLVVQTPVAPIPDTAGNLEIDANGRVKTAASQAENRSRNDQQ